MNEINYLKDWTVCKSRYNKKRRKNIIKTLIKHQQPKIDKINNNDTKNSNVSTYENHACVVTAAKNVSKTYYMPKMLEDISNKRPIQIMTRSPNQFPNYKTSFEIELINEYKGSVVLFDDMLDARNSSEVDEVYTRKRHEDLKVFFISQSYFGSPRQSIRINSDRLILFKQTLRDVQSLFCDIGAYDMKYDELKEMCHITWSESFNYRCIDMKKK